VKNFKEMVTLDPGDPLSRMYLGIALARAGDRKGAVEQYSEALRIAPGNAAVRCNLGMVLAELGAEQEAIEHFQAATQSDPQLTRAHFQLGNLLMRRGRYSEAPAEYAAVIRIEPRNAFARLMEAMALIRLKRYSEARDRLEQAMAALPTDIDLKTSLARLLAACPDESIRNGPRALELIQQVVQNGKSFDLEQGQTLAMALAAVGQFQQAAQVQGYMIAELERVQQSELAQLLQVNLTLYQRAQRCLIPWRDDDPIFSPRPIKMGVSADFLPPALMAEELPR
jgi:tetratricopeptide (TPR) repeat protein